MMTLVLSDTGRHALKGFILDPTWALLWPCPGAPMLRTWTVISTPDIDAGGEFSRIPYRGLTP